MAETTVIKRWIFEWGTIRTEHFYDGVFHSLRGECNMSAGPNYACYYNHSGVGEICYESPNMPDAIDSFLQNPPTRAFDETCMYLSYTGKVDGKPCVLELKMPRVRKPAAKQKSSYFAGLALPEGRKLSSIEEKLEDMNSRLADAIMTIYVERTLFDRDDKKLNYEFLASCIRHLKFDFRTFADNICHSIIDPHDRGGDVLLRLAPSIDGILHILQDRSDVLYAELLSREPPDCCEHWLRRLLALDELELTASATLANDVPEPLVLTPTIAVFDSLVDRQPGLKKYIADNYLSTKVIKLRAMLSDPNLVE